ncbi:MAG TPA: hypothetical protein VF767_02715 [Bryobacteraceae bacterium]
MARKEHFREPLAGSPTLESLGRRMAEGWRLSALEWEREAAGEIPEALQPAEGWAEEIPYGLQVSDDATRLIENPAESEVITLALDMIVEDSPLSLVSDELNRRGYRTRGGAEWSAAALFDLLPRMIQVSPRLFSSEKWLKRQRR